jgi:hypothetical protein
MFKEEGPSIEFILSGAVRCPSTTLRNRSAVPARVVEGSKGSALPRSGTASCYKFEKIHKKQQKYCIFNLCYHT